MYPFLIGLVVGQRDDENKRLYWRRDAESSYSGDTSRVLHASDIWAPFQTHQSRNSPPSYKNTFFFFFLNHWLPNLEGWPVSLDVVRVFKKNHFSHMNTFHVLILPMLCYPKSLQSCPTLCDPIDGSQPGSAILGILQARTLEWVAISFSNAWKRKVKVKVKSLSRVRLLATPWTAAHQAPPSMGFSRQEYWNGEWFCLAVQFCLNLKHFDLCFSWYQFF